MHANSLEMLMSNDNIYLNRPSLEGKYNVDVDIEISNTKLSEKGTHSTTHILLILIRTYLLISTHLSQVITIAYSVCLY